MFLFCPCEGGMDPPVQELSVKSVMHRREGCYDVKQLIERVWEPSFLVSQATGEPRHLCKRYFWTHIGLWVTPVWFRCPKFPGWIEKSHRPSRLPRMDTLIGQVGSAGEDEARTVMQREVAAIKQAQEEEFSLLNL